MNTTLLLLLLLSVGFALGYTVGTSRSLQQLLRLMEINADLRVLLAQSRMRQTSQERNESS